MESIDESPEISQEKVEPLQLLENSWFFNNLFITNKRTPPITIPRCYSDPCPSFSSAPNNEQEILVDRSMEEAFLAIKKLPAEGGGRFSRAEGLTRAPSLPEESAPQRVRKSNLQRSFSRGNNNNNNIARAPSLPASTVIRGDEIQDDESDFSMSRLIRQASLQQSDLLPPRSSKGVVATRSPSTPNQRQRTKPSDIENSGTTKSSSGGGEGRGSFSVGGSGCESGGGGGGGGGGVRRPPQQQHQQHGNRTRLARSTSDIGFQELVGFRELNYVEKKTTGEEQPSSSSSKTWHEQNNTNSPTTSQQQQVTEQWAADKRRSVEDDMKAQIKFWARTVASNVK